MIPFYIGLLLLLVSGFLFFISSRQRHLGGLPGGRVIYSDMHTWVKTEKPLYDWNLGLTGKPDYLVNQNGTIIPVEVKTSRTPAVPYDSHIFQVAAYCLLVERNWGKRPPYGIIHYAGRDFSVNYSEELENAVLEVLSEMRRNEQRGNVPRSHEVEERCKRCGFREVCDEKLT
jgi:CRISPR-associated exonuclease Cas4